MPIDLSPRQIQILSFYAHGLQRPEIAERLRLTQSTVRNHMHLVHRKLETHTTPHAVAKAIARGLIIFEEA